MAQTVRAKFTCVEITRRHFYTGVQVKFQPVYSQDPHDENKTFWEATPQGSLEMTITNPAAADSFQLGTAYYLDFTPAE